ncbi:hypothetical protein [Burkholderia savannae]|uniref:hypothetical protein n=1 Tax=Burkholderia savannae TaxID=1637837 RepID=UPI0012F48590|nr:hypothetical protein [Burkholderia savannae]
MQKIGTVGADVFASASMRLSRRIRDALRNGLQRTRIVSAEISRFPQAKRMQQVNAARGRRAERNAFANARCASVPNGNMHSPHLYLFRRFILSFHSTIFFRRLRLTNSRLAIFESFSNSFRISNKYSPRHFD